MNWIKIVSNLSVWEKISISTEDSMSLPVMCTLYYIITSSGKMPNYDRVFAKYALVNDVYEKNKGVFVT